MSGLFITFEGGEGTGKSTQMWLLHELLVNASVPVTALREPGDTALGEAVRRVLLDPGDAMDPLAELLLFEACRAQLVRQVIEPALARGEIVLCDRFADSSTAYQGAGRGLDPDSVRRLNSIATGGVVPERTLLYDIEPSQALSRATASGADRIEAEALDFHHRVREGFLAIARDEPGRVRVIDASGTIEQVAERTAAALADLPQLAAAWGAR